VQYGNALWLTLAALVSLFIGFTGACGIFDSAYPTPEPYGTDNKKSTCPIIDYFFLPSFDDRTDHFLYQNIAS
jgi:hypothetical protein